jgi:alpha-ribazole phosphatase
MTSTTLTLLRHGLCAGETEGRYIGHTDAPLTEEGRSQLCQMRETQAYPQAGAMFISPMKRCAETARILYPGLNPIELPGLKEYFFGEFEDKTPEQLENHPLFARWIAGEPGLAPPFAEDLGRFQARISETFVKLCDGLLKTGTKACAVVTHGGVIMALLAAFGLPEAPMHDWLAPGGCGFTLRIEPSIWLRARKCEVTAMAPEEPREDELPEERRLWLELEGTQWV